MKRFITAVLALALVGCAGQIAAQPTDEPSVSTKACPNGWTLRADAFSREALPSDLGEKIDRAIVAANARESRGGANLESYFTDAVSRTHGAELHKRASIADVDADIIIRYINRDSDGQLIAKGIGILHMRNGTGIFRFPDDPTSHVAIGTGWPGFFISPTASGSPKEPRLRIGRHEWRNRCDLRMSGIVP